MNKNEMEILKKERSEKESWRKESERVEKVKEEITKKMVFYRNIVKSLIDVNWNCSNEYLNEKIIETLIKKYANLASDNEDLEEEIGILEEGR